MSERVYLAMFLAMVLAGCAGTAGGVKPVLDAPKPDAFAKYENLVVKVTRADGVDLGPTETERLTRHLVEGIEKRRPGRFKAINGAPADPSLPTLEAVLLVTKYDKGRAFARAMLVGLGQIKIEGKVRLREPAADRQLGEYEVTKTFAWGGIYGATTSIEDVELGFVEAVLDTVLAKSQ
jgi:hypothetical protein